MIFVGKLFNCLTNKQWRYNSACHLFCDKPENLEELHKFAQRIGLKRSWFQNNPTLPHYDLTSNKRNQAIKAGAVSTDKHREVYYIRRWRNVLKD